MHASEEDLKMMVALLKPRYYIPVKGFYKDLLSNAEVALSMGSTSITITCSCSRMA
jgi:ribonuclease J